MPGKQKAKSDKRSEEDGDLLKKIVSDPKFKALKRKKKEDVEDPRFELDKRFGPQHTGDTSSELSSSSDESESEVEDLGEEEERQLAEKRLEYDWKPLDDDAETADKTFKRLAIQNFDYKQLNAKDIYVLINSIRPPLGVKVYVSEFGKRRLEREEKEGPEEIVEMVKVDEVEEEYNELKNKMRVLTKKEPRSSLKNVYEDADEVTDPKNEEMRERIRRYQLNRMKYYYAIAEFDSVESAEVVYKELDGVEYGGSSLELDLRFVPDDVEFDKEDMKEDCSGIDLTSYKAPQFIISALQQTNVKLTWEEGDTRREEKLRAAFTKEELEKDDLEAYLATESDTDDEEEEEGEIDDALSIKTGNSEARAQKYKALLATLDKEEESKKKTDIDIEWGDFSDDEQGRLKAGSDSGESSLLGGSGDEEEDDNFNDDDDDSDDLEDDKESTDEEEEVKTKRKNRKKPSKKSKRKLKQDQESNDSEHDNELELLVMDTNSAKREEFKFDPDDERFKAVYESGLYNVDPSHPNFKHTAAFDMMAERKRQKRQRVTFSG